MSTPRGSSSSRAADRGSAKPTGGKRSGSRSTGGKQSSGKSASKTPSRRRVSGDAYRAKRLAESRFGIVYDVDGPRVRLGVAWFVAAIAAMYLGIGALAVLVAAIAALAAAQTAQALRTRWRRPDLAISAVVAALIPVAAAWGAALAGVTVIIGSLAAVATAGPRSQRRREPMIDGSAVVRSAVFAGLAGAWLVMLYRFEIGAAVTLVLMASAYEVGDYLVGSGASNPVEGPFAGLLALAATTLVLTVVPPPPFSAASLWLYAMVVLVGVPLGQVLASAILPRAGAGAPALRRLDSYLFTGALWLVLLSSGIGL